MSLAPSPFSAVRNWWLFIIGMLFMHPHATAAGTWPPCASDTTPTVQFGSTDTALTRAFAWAKSQALHYKGRPGDPVGPWYESALPPRDAFCMRDVSHQAIGGAILGLDAENKNMLTLFAKNISAAKNWCSYWEMNKHGIPALADYRNDKEFWYNLTANFDVLDATWRLAAWTGDTSYYQAPVFRYFQQQTADAYIRNWVLQPDSLLTRPAHPNAPIPFNEKDAFHRCRGLPSYSEGIRNIKMGVDLVAALYRGLTTYASILNQRGQKAAALAAAQRAERYRRHLEDDWWSDSLGRYHTWYSTDNHFGVGEGETFLLWFDALHDTARIRRTIDHLASTGWNMENNSYLPYLYYREGFWDTARRALLHDADPATKRREYPEVSFGIVQAVVLGLMGVEPLPGKREVTTLYRCRNTGTATTPDRQSGPDSVRAATTSDSAWLTDLPILGTTLDIRHHSPFETTVANTGKRHLSWRAQFYGSYRVAYINGDSMAMSQRTDKWGRIISYVSLPMLPGWKVTVRVKTDINASPTLHRLIQTSIRTKAKLIVLPGGRLDCWPDGAEQKELYISNATEDDTGSKKKSIALCLENAHDLTIEGNNTLLVLHGKMVSFALLNCSNITIKNLKVDYARPTMSEMTIREIKNDHADVAIHPDSRYRIDDTGRIHFVGEGWESRDLFAIAYDPAAETMHYSSMEPFLQSRATTIAPSLVRFQGDFSKIAPNNDTLPGNALSGNALPGNTLRNDDVLTIRDPYRDNVGALIANSRDINLDNLDMYYMHGLGIVSQFSADLRFKNIQIAPRPGSGRIVSAFADCFHFSGCKGEILLDSCHTMGSHDDAVNVHGTHLRIVAIGSALQTSAASPTSTISPTATAKTLRVRFMHPQTWGFPAFFAGDSIAYINPQTLLPIGYGVVQNTREINRREQELQLEQIPPDSVHIGDCLENLSWTPAVTIRHCRFERTNTRGVLVTTRRKVLIEDNIFYKTGMHAILIADDALGWYESGPVGDVTIRRNRFIGCGYNSAPDDFTIAIAPDNKTTLPGAFIHHNINITGNDFDTPNGLLLTARSVDGLSFLDNHIIVRNNASLRNNATVPHKAPDTSPFRITACTNVHLQNVP